jgi:ribosome biogenesis GTPase
MDTPNSDALGYDEWFRTRFTELAGADIRPNASAGFAPARVTEVNRNSYTVCDGLREMAAELSGKFLFDAESALDYPTVGDWVAIQALDDCTLAIVHAVLARKTVLKRKTPGKRVDFQLIAANIDYGLVVQPADHLNGNLLDRYFVMLHESGIEPVAVFNKIDLLTPPELDALTEQTARLNAQSLYVSAVAADGLDELSAAIAPGKTYCLLGQSGVGKTSLLNSLSGERALKVSAVREKDGRGRHTTVRRQLIRLESGGIFIDTPGMRELGNFNIDEGLEIAFDDISVYAAACRYRDCTHRHEEGCAVREAVERGDIEQSRYENYLKLKKESDHYTMSYRQKREKDKKRAKIRKFYNKNVRNR